MTKKPNRSSTHANPSKQQKNDATPQAIIAFKDALIKEGDANRQQEGGEDRWNKIIAVATLFLVFCTTGGIIYQDIVLHSSDSAFQISATAAKDAAIAAKKSSDAVANIERPYLFIQAHPSQNIPRDGPYPTADATPTIAYTITNFGRVPGVIRSAYVECFVNDGLPTPPRYSAENMHGALNAIGPNLTSAGLPPCKLNSPITSFDWALLKSNTKSVFLITWMIYEGALNATYISGVAYRIDPFTGDAFPTTNAEYNYDRTVEGRLSQGTPVPMPYLTPRRN
jgi:hypothetical protein